MTLTKTKALSKPKTIREPLRWLFTAYFDDGSSIVQDQDDKCHTRKDGTGSTFTDVLTKDGLVSFELNHDNGSESVMIDLTTGAFLVNGTPLHAHNQFFEPQKYKLELVYFRETRVDQQLDKLGNEVSVNQYTNRYFIGWKTQVNGKDKQVTIAVG